MSSTVSIKGTREGLTITLGTGELAPLLNELRHHLATQGAFFRDGTVALQLGDRPLEEQELSHISELLTEHQMALRTVVTTNETTRQSASVLGLRLVDPNAPRRPPRPRPAARVSPSDGTRGLLIRRLVRSGQVVRHTGHIVILGDVNAGAEVIAGGDVIVWGRLQGLVHAGSVNNQQAVVCALDLQPTQLRIGQLIARPNDQDRTKEPRPEIAWVRDDKIIVEPWDRTTWRV